MAHCPICGLTLQKKSYARHLRLHGDVVPEICPYCQKGFRERRSLDKHIKAVHYAERPFACEYCPERFTNADEQRQHHQGHLRGVGAAGAAAGAAHHYQCQVCDVTFLKQEDLDTHSKTHRVDGKLFICEICQKNFSNEQNKRIHVLRHQGSWPHKCDVCSLTFQLKSQLQRHSASHTRSTQVVTAKINTFLESFSASLEDSDMLDLGGGGGASEAAAASVAVSSSASSASAIGTDPSGGAADLISSVVGGADMVLPNENSLEAAAAEAAMMFGQSDLTEELLNESAFEDLSAFDNLDIPELKPGQLLQCPNCDDKMATKRAYLLHLKKHATQLNYKCRLCPKTFVGKSNLEMHFARAHPGQPLPAVDASAVGQQAGVGLNEAEKEKAVSVQVRMLFSVELFLAMTKKLTYLSFPMTSD